MRLLFFGTPGIAVPFLEACAREHDVLAVVTRPDKPAGRGLALTPPPVKEAAQRLGLPALQPAASPSELAPALKALGADAAIVVAYGKILKPDLLASTRLGFLNVHFSLLPKYRGAAPIQWSLIRGETRSGVTVFWLDEGMDTGPVQAVRETEIGPDEDAPSLAARLTALGVELLSETLRAFDAGVRRQPQTGEPSLAPRLTRADARVSLSWAAREVHDRVRGLRGGPTAYFEVRGSPVNLLRTSLETAEGPGRPGFLVRVAAGGGFLIECLTGTLWVHEVQPQGKRPLPAADFLNGLRLKAGDRLPD
ncbi:MAG: methionyl-tRNA formyltransferase [Elusimicrobia bacterium]|nr:methionyl-tRNA formyltransferase [Elusimicrobiota bacterium]